MVKDNNNDFRDGREIHPEKRQNNSMALKKPPV